MKERTVRVALCSAALIMLEAMQLAIACGPKSDEFKVGSARSVGSVRHAQSVYRQFVSCDGEVCDDSILLLQALNRCMQLVWDMPDDLSVWMRRREDLNDLVVTMISKEEISEPELSVAERDAHPFKI